MGKGELHSHPYHVDSQVGSCIFLNVFMLNHSMCTEVGSNPCRRLSLLGIAHPSRDHYFKYRKCSGRRRPLEVAFEKKTGLWLWHLFCMTYINIVNLNICWY